MIEFVPFADRGRSFTSSRLVRLSDADSRGVLRPDGLARCLQDVATDDWASTGIEADDTWVVRRTVVRVIALKNEEIDLDTWIDAVTRALVQEAQASERGREALERLLN